jgi:hypothetical protein
LLAGWHDPPRSGRRSPYQPVLLMPSAECELAHTGQRARACSAAPWGRWRRAEAQPATDSHSVGPRRLAGSPAHAARNRAARARPDY